jgi:hypothetical protein
MDGVRNRDGSLVMLNWGVKQTRRSRMPVLRLTVVGRGNAHFDCGPSTTPFDGTVPWGTVGLRE